MSFVNFSEFRAASSLEIPFTTREPESFTTTVLNHSTVLEFGLVCKGARITNDDTIANLTVRLHSNRGAARIVPPSAEITLTEWFSDIFITPNAVSGTGTLELDVVKIKDALRPKRSEPAF